MYNNSSEIGNIGETIALSEFAKRGITVLIPFGQNVPYDLVIEINNKLYKIQCKTTQKLIDGCKMRFNICRTNGFTGTHNTYTEEEIDFLCLYCIENDYIALVPIKEVLNQRDFVIRITKPKNNQTYGIHMADDYTLENQLRTISTTVSASGS